MSMLYVPTKGHGYVAGLRVLLGAMLMSEGYAELAQLLTCHDTLES